MCYQHDLVFGKCQGGVQDEHRVDNCERGKAQRWELTSSRWHKIHGEAENTVDRSAQGAGEARQEPRAAPREARELPADVQHNEVREVHRKRKTLHGGRQFEREVSAGKARFNVFKILPSGSVYTRGANQRGTYSSGSWLLYDEQEKDRGVLVFEGTDGSRKEFFEIQDYQVRDQSGGSRYPEIRRYVPARELAEFERDLFDYEPEDDQTEAAVATWSPGNWEDTLEGTFGEEAYDLYHP